MKTIINNAGQVPGVYTLWIDDITMVYFGSSTNIKKRIYFHYWLLRKNAHHIKKLQEDFNRYDGKTFNYCTQPMPIDEATATESKLISLTDRKYNINTAPEKRKVRDVEEERRQFKNSMKIGEMIRMYRYLISKGITNCHTMREITTEYFKINNLAKSQ